MSLAARQLRDEHAPAPMILLVDDDNDILEAMTPVLQNEGFNVRTATHGQDALEQLKQGLTPRLILLDLMMPTMDGWQLRNKLRTTAQWASIPVVVITAGHTAPFDVDAVLLKPIGYEKLRWALRLAR